jgi:hypothetical protein
MAFLAMVFVSCNRTPFSLIAETHSVSSFTRYTKNGEVLFSYENLSIYIETADSQEKSLQMEVTSPSGLNTWSFQANRKEVDGITYFGSSDLVLDTPNAFENGLWHLLVMRKDGKSLETDFPVSTRLSEHRENQLSVEFDKENGTLSLKGQDAVLLKGYVLSLLTENKTILYEGELQETQFDVKELTEKWKQINSLLIGTYDAAANLSIVSWYAL